MARAQEWEWRRKRLGGEGCWTGQPSLGLGGSSPAAHGAMGQWSVAMALGAASCNAGRLARHYASVLRTAHSAPVLFLFLQPCMNHRLLRHSGKDFRTLHQQRCPQHPPWDGFALRGHSVHTCYPFHTHCICGAIRCRNPRCIPVKSTTSREKKRSTNTQFIIAIIRHSSAHHS